MKKRNIIISVISFVIIACVIIAGIIIWENHIEDTYFPLRWGTVDKKMVFRSGRLSNNLMKKTLKEHNIKTIVNLNFSKAMATSPATFSENLRDAQFEYKTAKELGIRIFYYPMGGDGIGPLKNYIGAVAKIAESKRAGKPVQVHCAAGSYRTGGVIAVYSLLVEKKSPDFVYNELLKYGWEPSNNHKFIKFLNKNMKTFATGLMKKGIIKEMPNPIPTLHY